jgi:hypothetical protein
MSRGCVKVSGDMLTRCVDAQHNCRPRFSRPSCHMLRDIDRGRDYLRDGQMALSNHLASGTAAAIPRQYQ